MGRLRPEPARPPRPSYNTPEGQRRLLDELDQLWRVQRPAVTRAVSEAAAQGDRSENAEYIYGKKQLREIDRRVRHLRRRLSVLTVVDQEPPDRTRVFFGAWVRVAVEARRARRLRIVGPDEAAQAKHLVSVDSPLARALLGKRVGDEVVVVTPKGRLRYRLRAICYGAPPARDEEE